MANARFGKLLGIPNCLSRVFRHTVVQKVHIQLACLLAVVSKDELFVVGEFAYYRRFDVFIVEDFCYGLQVFRPDRDDHSLLRFRNPDFGVVKAGVL